MANTTSTLGNVVKGYKTAVPYPWMAPLLTGGLVLAGGKLLWNPIMRTVRSLGRFPAKAMGATDQSFDAGMDDIQYGHNNSWWIPGLVGGLAAAAHAGLTMEPDRKYYGFGDWNAAVKKTASLHDSNYIDPVDFGQIVRKRDAQDLFMDDPFLSQPQNSYTRQLGTAIVADAANRSGSTRMTLGNVFDSAVDKIDKKLSFSGALGVGARTVIANQTATLFASAVGSMFGMQPETRRAIIDAGTWAGAITSILN